MGSIVSSIDEATVSFEPKLGFNNGITYRFLRQLYMNAQKFELIYMLFIAGFP
jgi:hypothetical protein